MSKSKEHGDKPKRGRGRPRHGAEKKVLIPIRVSADVKRYLDDQGNRSAFVDQLIKRTKAFKDWQKNN